jgi:hypothetical protein
LQSLTSARRHLPGPLARLAGKGPRAAARRQTARTVAPAPRSMSTELACSSDALRLFVCARVGRERGIARSGYTDRRFNALVASVMAALRGQSRP